MSAGSGRTALAGLALLAALVPAAAQGPADLKWQVRPLLIFAPAGSPDAALQEAMLAADPALVADLRLAAIIVTGEAVRPLAGAAEPNVSAAVLRESFSVTPDEFRVVLVGLDGGAKLTRAEPIALSELERTINAMPMRRQELRRRAAD